MTISRTYQWFRHATNDAAASPVTISGATNLSYTTVQADVGLYIHVRETATNQFGSASANSNVVGPIAAAGETYTPAPGTVAPIEANIFTGRSLTPRFVRRSEQDALDGEQLAMVPLCDLARNQPLHTIATTSGNWSNPAIWDNGVPAAGMHVHIDTGVNVLYDVESAAQLGFVVVDEGATLRWDVSKDTHLVCDTLHGCPSSYIQIGTKSSPATFSATTGKARVKIDFIGMAPGSSANNPGVTASGSNLTLGMMTMGKVDIYGAEIKEKVDINSVGSAGATTITAKTASEVANWRVGDWVVVLGRQYSGFGPDPEYDGPTNYYVAPNLNDRQIFGSANGFKKFQDELRQITAINNGVITLDSALTYAHPEHTTSHTLISQPHALAQQFGFQQGQTVTLPARVMNMSRSIEFESTGNLRKANGKINTQTRAHIMFHACDQVDVRWFGCKNMARTNVDPTLTVTEPPPKMVDASHQIHTFNRCYADLACTTDLADPNNVRGRYAIHFHGPGPNHDGARFNRNMRVLVGAACWATRGAPPQPGWVITHHASNLSISQCCVFYFRGGGIVSEASTEIGQWLDCTVAAGLGDGFEPSWATRQMGTPNHNGHAGIAYEMQARNILIRNCEATGCNKGWLAAVQLDDGISGPTKGGADPQSLRILNPIIQGTNQRDDRDQYGQGQAQITDWHGLVGCDLDSMFEAMHRVTIERNDATPFVAIGWRVCGVNCAVNLINYTYNYFFRDFAYFGGNGGAAVSAGTKTFQFGWKNGIIEGYTYFAAPGGNINHGPGWIDIATEMTQDPEDLGGRRSSSSFPAVAPSFTMDRANPQFYINLSGDTQYFGIRFGGTWTDGFSPSGRLWPLYFENQMTEPDYGASIVHTTGGCQPWGLVERNGCYQVNGQWVMPCWFGQVDWATFDAVFFKVEIPLSGPWPADFLAANNVSPSLPPPTHPLLPQDINKPFPTISPPSNLSPPTIAGRTYVGGKLEILKGEWSKKPNDVDWWNYQWLRNGTVDIGFGRTYVPTSADIGQQITAKVTAYNAGGVSAPVSASNFVTGRAGYSGPTPDTIFGSAFKDWWDMDDPDAIYDDYYPGGAYVPGTQLTSEYMALGWASNRTLTNFVTFNGGPTALNNGWIDGSRCLTTAPDSRGRSKFRMWGNIGSDNNPCHLFVVIRRPNVNQTDGNAPVLRGFGHDTWVSNETAQNVIGNTASGQTLATFPKGTAGVLYHGRDSGGQRWGFNNTRFAAGNGGITDGNRDVELTYNSALIDFKAIYWVEADGLTSQQYADMQAYLAWKYGF